MLVRVAGVAGTAEVMRLLRPLAVVLDLDLHGELAWHAAEVLLDQKNCPPLILVTARTQLFDVRTAVRAGSIIDKAAGAVSVLDFLDQVLALSAVARVDRNAVQRVLIRWLRPRGWSAPVSAPRVSTTHER